MLLVIVTLISYQTVQLQLRFLSDISHNTSIALCIMFPFTVTGRQIPCIFYTRNELASLAHSFYTCLKHQLIHLTIIVLLRSIYLGFLVVWSFIPRDTFILSKIHDRPCSRCGAARPAQLRHQRERACAHP